MLIPSYLPRNFGRNDFSAKNPGPDQKRRFRLTEPTSCPVGWLSNSGVR